MRRVVARLSAVVVLAMLGDAAHAQPATPPAASPEGTWLTEDGTGVVEIAPCGQDLCGRIVGIGEFQPDGSAPRDTQGRSECGLTILVLDSRTGAESWEGRVTDPEDGRTYNTTVRLDDAGRLRLRGYIGIPLFGSTQTWTRYPGRLTPDCHMQQ